MAGVTGENVELVLPLLPSPTSPAAPADFPLWLNGGGEGAPQHLVSWLEVTIILVKLVV